MTLKCSWKTVNLPLDANIQFSWIGLQPHFKYIRFVRIPDLRWTPAARVQIWIFVDLQPLPNHCDLPIGQTPSCTH